MRAARSSGEQDHCVPIIDPSADTDDRHRPELAFARKLQMLLHTSIMEATLASAGRVLHGTEADRPTLWIGFDLAHGHCRELRTASRRET